MGNKHKKQMRARRVQETRAKQRAQLDQGGSKGGAKSSKSSPKRKFVPIREMPVIVFVRGEDYEPVKYGIREGKEVGLDEMMSLDGPEDPEQEPEEVPQGEPGEPLSEPEEVPEELEPSNSEDLEVVEESEELLEMEETTASPSFIDPSGPPSEDDDSQFDPSTLFEDAPSDASMLSEPLNEADFIALDREYAEHLAERLARGSDASDSELELEDMSMDIDYNDMEYEDLVQFGHGIDDDFSYDLDADSDADDIISGLLSGASLESYAAKHAKPQKGRNKQPLSKRRRERLEARDAQRAQNFGKGPALWQKYPTGLSVHEVVEELQTLVATPNLHEIQFPPLDANANWYVEQLANLHNLKSKTFTKNHANCLRVIKTSRSGPPEYNKMQKLLRRRQNFWRVDVDRAPREKGDGSGSRVKTSRPKEGDIVGHNARVVDEGFGHRMLLEMGWNSGSGLGKLKDGIQAPLLARVKLTKRGL